MGEMAVKISKVNQEELLNNLPENTEIIALWESISKQDNLYLSGLTNENEKIIAFYSNKEQF